MQFFFIFPIAQKKNIPVKYFYGGSTNMGDWSIVLTKNLNDYEVNNYIRLLNSSSQVVISDEYKDMPMWSPSKKRFFCQFVLFVLDQKKEQL